MYLYRQEVDGQPLVQIYHNFDVAYRAAIHFVGEHNDVDGCSSPRQEFQLDDRFRTWRSTSFGTRKATVQPIRDDRLECLF